MNENETTSSIIPCSSCICCQLAEMSGLSVDTRLGIAVKHGSVEQVKKFIANGANKDMVGKNNHKLLHIAAEFGRRDIVEFLISKSGDGDIHEKSTTGQTPLHLASENGHYNVVEFLIGKGADINARNNHGSEPLHYASQNGYCDVVELLISQGANVNARNDHNWTPLHYAIFLDHHDTVELLISKGADVNARDNDDQTPLFSADNINTIELLLVNKADPFVLDKHGKTAFEMKKPSVILDIMTRFVALNDNNKSMKQEVATLQDEKTALSEEITKLHDDNNSLKQDLLQRQQHMASLLQGLQSVKSQCQDVGKPHDPLPQ